MFIVAIAIEGMWAKGGRRRRVLGCAKHMVNIPGNGNCVTVMSGILISEFKLNRERKDDTLTDISYHGDI